VGEYHLDAHSSRVQEEMRQNVGLELIESKSMTTGIGMLQTLTLFKDMSVNGDDAASMFGSL
jgi:hypothetical protein